jgi:hypothetical protein
MMGTILASLLVLIVFITHEELKKIYPINCIGFRKSQSSLTLIKFIKKIMDISLVEKRPFVPTPWEQMSHFKPNRNKWRALVPILSTLGHSSLWSRSVCGQYKPGLKSVRQGVAGRVRPPTPLVPNINRDQRPPICLYNFALSKCEPHLAIFSLLLTRGVYCFCSLHMHNMCSMKCLRGFATCVHT